MIENKKSTKKNQYFASHFKFKKYLSLPRWISYWHQIDEIISDTEDKLNGVKCLVIGKGDNIVPEILSSYGIAVYTFDFSSDLSPDFCGDVKNLLEVVGETTFDYILCCQVLEHLEHQFFEKIIAQMRKVVTKKVVLSLPYANTSFILKAKVPKLKFKDICISVPKFWISNMEKNPEHYWEVGIRGYSKKKIRSKISKYFYISKEYSDVMNTYHRFFVLEPLENRGADFM